MIEQDERACILYIEDDDDIARIVRTLLERAGYRFLLASDGREGLRRFHDERPDLVILDLGLPALDGWTVMDRIREFSDAPILVLTARGTETDKVRGLRAGADDYLVKPFGNAELIARVEVLLRRGESPRAAGEPVVRARSRILEEHGIEIDFDAFSVKAEGRPVDLTPTEFRLLETLIGHRGQVLSAEQLLQLAWRDPTATGPDRVKFAMLRLRRKLGWDRGPDSPIETLRGFGYRYRPPA